MHTHTDIEDEKFHHLEYMSSIFTTSDYENRYLISKLNTLPIELKSIILTMFVCRMSKHIPHPMINKQELHDMSNKNNRAFTAQLNTIVGRSRVFSNLEIVSNILSTNYFHENYHDLVFVFNSNIGFEPSLHYLQKLEKIFPTNRLFRVVNIYREELNWVE